MGVKGRWDLEGLQVVCRKGRKPGGPPLHSGTQRLNFESVEENDDLRRRNKDFSSPKWILLGTFDTSDSSQKWILLGTFDTLHKIIVANVFHTTDLPMILECTKKLFFITVQVMSNVIII